jgi:hypothetical protein
MTVLTPKSTKDVTELLDEVMSSARYLIDAKGGKTDVVLSLSAWEKLLTWLEALDDRVVVQEWLPRLKAGPASSGALRWEDVSADWEDENDPAV